MISEKLRFLQAAYPNYAINLPGLLDLAGFAIWKLKNPCYNRGYGYNVIQMKDILQNRKKSGILINNV